jgi:RNA polymerase sigma factor (sigma-70 family)
MSQPADKSALALVFRRHAGSLRRFLQTRRGACEAEDLVQEGFVRLLQNGAAVFPDNPAAWLYRTCANLAADAYDRRCVRDDVHVECEDVDDIEDAASDPAQRVGTRQQLQRVWIILQCLPEPCRHAFLLNRLDGLSQKAVAAHLGISEKTVERHVLRALEACRKALAEDV